MSHRPITEGDVVYVDPNASAPDTQSTSPSSSPPFGDAGSGIGDLVEAANSGNLRVDEATGAATIQAITAIQDQLDVVRRIAATSAGGDQLGGGYARQIDQFNREWSVDGEDSATAVMDRFDAELSRLREAVEACMTTYRTTDERGERRVDQAGSLLTEGNS